MSVLFSEVQEFPVQVFLHRDLQRADLRPAGQRLRHPVPQREHQEGRVCRGSRGEVCHLGLGGLPGRHPETHIRVSRKLQRYPRPE